MLVAEWQKKIAYKPAARDKLKGGATSSVS